MRHPISGQQASPVSKVRVHEEQSIKLLTVQPFRLSPQDPDNGVNVWPMLLFTGADEFSNFPSVQECDRQVSGLMRTACLTPSSKAKDLDDLLEVNQWPDKANTFRSVDSKTKAAFTRKCNKERVTLPYSIPSTLCKKRTRVGEEENIEEEETVENDLNIVIKRSKITGRDDRGRPKEKRRK